jgi:hypothetical protein
MRIRPLVPVVFLCAPLASFPSTPRCAAAGEAGASGPSATEDDAATIVLVGDVSPSATLASLLAELLGRQGVELRLLRRPRFDAGEFLATTTKDRAVWVFVELADAHKARLSFRGPEARRFLLRELWLRDGLDELGRELVGQVVESSVVSLLRSSEGMTLAEARAALLASAAVPGTSAESIEGGRPALVTPRPAFPRWAAWIGARYEGGWTGADLGGAHGPGAELGIERRGALRLRATLFAEWLSSQAFDSPEVTARIQTWPLRLSADAGWAVARAQTCFLGLGAGADVTRVEAAAASGSGVTPNPPSTRLLPVLRASLRYEFGFAPFAVALAAFVDASLLTTHYDLVRAGVGQRVAVPWPIRPGGALVLAWAPEL